MDEEQKAISYICKHTGLSGIEAKHIYDAIQKLKTVSVYDIDWEQAVSAAKEYGNRYEAVWNYLHELYGIPKPMSKEEIKRRKAEAEKAEVEYGKKYLEEVIEDVLSKFKNGEKEEIKEHLREIVMPEKVERIKKLEEKLKELIKKKEEIEKKLKTKEKEEIKKQLEEVNPDVTIEAVEYKNGMYKVIGKIKPEYEKYFLTKFIGKPIIAEGTDVEVVKSAFNAEVSRRHKAIPTVVGGEILGREAVPIPKMFVGSEIPALYFYKHACPHIINSFDPEVFRKTGVLLCEKCKGKIYNRSDEEAREIMKKLGLE